MPSKPRESFGRKRPTGNRSAVSSARYRSVCRSSMPLTASRPESTANSTAGYRVPVSAFNVPESRMSFGMETRFLSEVSGNRTVTKPRSSNKPFSRRFPESRSGSVGETSVPSSEREAIPGTATSAGAMRSRPSVPEKSAPARSVLPAARFLKVSPTGNRCAISGKSTSAFRLRRSRACGDRSRTDALAEASARTEEEAVRSWKSVRNNRALSIPKRPFMERTVKPLRSSRDNRSTSIRTALPRL